MKEFKYSHWEHPWLHEPSLLDVKHCERIGAMARPGTVAIDIGAFTGDTTLPIAANCDRCYAFEPNPNVLPVLEANVKQNPHLDIVVLPVAVAPSTQPMTFYYNPVNGGAFRCPECKHVEPVTVWAVPLESVLATHDEKRQISLIKIDTEGFDLPILESIVPVIEAHQPALVVEEFPFQTPSYKKELWALLRELGYEPEQTGYDLFCRATGS